MRLAIIVFVFCLVLSGSVRNAEACSCTAVPNSTRESRLEIVRRAVVSSDFVFLGKLVSGDDATAVLAVEKVWKGQLDQTVRLHQATRRGPELIEWNTCVLQVSKGTWVIFARQKEPGLFVSGVCSPSGRLEHRAEVLEFLKEISGVDLR